MPPGAGRWVSRAEGTGAQEGPLGQRHWGEGTKPLAARLYRDTPCGLPRKQQDFPSQLGNSTGV